MYTVNLYCISLFQSSCLLFRVSEEKEESVQRLKDEQGLFECKIQQMAEQNVIIAQERESILLLSIDF